MPSGVIWGAYALKLWHPSVPVALPYRVDVAVTSRHRPQFRIRPRTVVAAPRQRVELKGIPVQAASAALADSLTSIDERAADSLFAWAVTRDLATAEGLSQEASMRSNARGVARLRRYAEMWREGAASPLEVVFQIVMRRHRITGWAPNVRLSLPGGIHVRVDVLFDTAKLVIEIDGWLAHSSREAFQKDRKNQNALTKAGYRILRFTWEDLTQNPEQCADTIKETLTSWN
jgi:very-short-patch-repair endonuclease